MRNMEEMGDWSELTRKKKKRRGRKMDRGSLYEWDIMHCYGVYSFLINSNQDSLALGCSLPLHWRYFYFCTRTKFHTRCHSIVLFILIYIYASIPVHK
jgi:hypothetical protein